MESFTDDREKVRSKKEKGRNMERFTEEREFRGKL